ncbi:carboxypeptidase-like regulatory domain-containing protein [Thalassotalea litorea]|uniref:carboxypeptidase-like regulatory domain-containing protein n=1 Tax=Thalassotalea litorea TaxID=2020715 RepID=UPI00373577BE
MMNIYNVIRSLIFGITILTLAACGGGSNSGDSERSSVVDSPTNVTPSTVILSTYTEIDLNEVIELVAEASDSDGSITKIEWQSDIGTFSHPNSLNTSFTAPATNSSDEITITLVVTDNQGASASDTLTLALLAPKLIISGMALYENVTVDEDGYDYDGIHDKPIRGASVYLLDETEAVVATVHTNEQGYYEFKVRETGIYSVDIVAELGTDISHKNYVSVRDNMTASESNRNYGDTTVYRYPVFKEQMITEAQTEFNFKAELNWNRSTQQYEDGRTAPVFALLDQAWEMQSLLFNWRENIQLPALTIFWNENNIAIDGVWWLGQIETSAFAAFSDNGVFVRSDKDINIDEYDRTIIAHELGHFVLANLTRNETIGGHHTVQSVMDIRPAFAEGFSSYFAWLMTGSEFILDADGKYNSRASKLNIFSHINERYNRGWYYETVNSHVLKTFTEGDGDYGIPPSSSNFVLDIMHDDMRSSDALISLHSFIGHAFKRNGISTELYRDYLLSKGISATDEWGTGETYGDAPLISKNLLTHTYLPIYTDIEANQEVTACLNDTIEGNGNRLGVWKYFIFTVEEAKKYTLNWSSDDSYAHIWSWTASGESYLAGGGNHTLTGSLDAGEISGTHIVGVSFYGNSYPNASPNAPTIESGCITFSITD